MDSKIKATYLANYYGRLRQAGVSLGRAFKTISLLAPRGPVLMVLVPGEGDGSGTKTVGNALAEEANNLIAKIRASYQEAFRLLSQGERIRGQQLYGAIADSPERSRLVEIGAAAVPSLIKAAEEEFNGAVFPFFRRCLVEIGDKRAAPLLGRYLLCGNYYLERKVVAGDLEHFGKEGIDYLVQVLNRREIDEIRFAVARTLKKVAEASTIGPLLSYAEDIVGDDILNLVGEIISEIINRGREAEETLRGFLGDQDKTIRVRAAKLTASRGEREAINILLNETDVRMLSCNPPPGILVDLIIDILGAGKNAERVVDTLNAILEKSAKFADYLDGNREKYQYRMPNWETYQRLVALADAVPKEGKTNRLRRQLENEIAAADVFLARGLFLAIVKELDDAVAKCEPVEEANEPMRGAAFLIRSQIEAWGPAEYLAVDFVAYPIYFSHSETRREKFMGHRPGGFIPIEPDWEEDVTHTSTYRGREEIKKTDLGNSAGIVFKGLLFGRLEQSAGLLHLALQVPQDQGLGEQVLEETIRIVKFLSQENGINRTKKMAIDKPLAEMLGKIGVTLPPEYTIGEFVDLFAGSGVKRQVMVPAEIPADQAGAILIQNELGLHARVAAQMVRLASGFSCEIKITTKGKTVSAKSITGILSLGAGKGSRVSISATGPDAIEAERAVREYLEKLTD